jgi:hypothetical protein
MIVIAFVAISVKKCLIKERDNSPVPESSQQNSATIE